MDDRSGKDGSRTDDAGGASRSNESLEQEVARLRVELEEIRGARAKLQQVNNQLSVILEQQPIVPYTSRAGGDYGATYVSPKVLEITGYRAEQLVGDSAFWADHVHPDDAERVFAELPGLFDHGYQVTEYRWRIADGSYRWFYDRSELVLDERGEPDYIVGAWMDITDRKLAEEELKQKKEFLDTLIDNIPDLVSAHAPSGELTLVNRTFCEYLGVDESVVGRPIADAIRRTHGNTLHERSHQAMKSGEPQRWQEALAREGEGDRTFETVVVPYGHGDGHHHRGTIAVSRDVTQREEAIRAQMARDKAELASRSKSEFLANMSHEIRTPLNSILGYSQLLARRAHEGSLPDYVREYIEHISLNGYNLSEIINNILELSKIEEGKVTVSPEPVDLALLIQRVHNLSKLHASNKDIELTYHFDPELPRMLHTDRTKLTQILSNLLSNAVKFTPAGKRIQIEAHRRSEKVVFTVADEGIGIPAAKQTTIFEAFEQADSSITRSYGGTGLGLAICKRLVDVLGGRIWLDSTEGEGSTFFVELSLEATADAPQRLEAVSPIAFAPDSRVLVVEDNPMNQTVVREMFRELGIEVVIADNGQEGVRKALELQPECVLMDLHMPKMDGLEATRQLRELPEFAEVPIIALSADAFAEQRRVAFEAGITDYLTKPILMDKLISKLARYLRRTESEAPKPGRVLDMDSLSQYAKPLFTQLCGLFIALVPESIGKLKSYARERRAGDVAEEAHTLKNYALGVFATRFSMLCVELELTSKKADWARVDAVIGELDPAYQEVVLALEQVT